MVETSLDIRFAMIILTKIGSAMHNIFRGLLQSEWAKTAFIKSLKDQAIHLISCQANIQLQAGGCSRRAKQKAFGSLPAPAPSLAYFVMRIPAP
jgi:hypothetical protein